MTVSPINPYLPPPPDVESTTYGKIMDAFFSTLSDAQKQTIWVKFLTANNLTAPVPPGSEQLFLTFIHDAIMDTQLFVPVSTNAKLSPDEIKKRNIMFLVFNSVIKMLLSLQQTVTVEAQNVAFYAKWQKEYTNMLTRVPSYVGGEASDVNVDLTDLSKFTLGYNNISVEDIAKWWAQSKLDGSNQTFTVSHYLTLNATQTSYITFQFSPSGIGATSSDFGTNTGSINNFGPFVPITAGSTFDQNVKNFEDAFRSYYGSMSTNIAVFSNILAAPYLNTLASQIGTISANTTNTTQQQQLIQSQIFTPTSKLPTNPSNFTLPNNTLLSILKPYTYVAPSNVTDPANALKNLSDSNSKARAEINSRDQQYIENIRSKRQTVQDTQSQIQANLDQSRQTVTQQSDLLSSIIDSLKGLIAAIFR